MSCLAPRPILFQPCVGLIQDGNANYGGKAMIKFPAPPQASLVLGPLPTCMEKVLQL